MIKTLIEHFTLHSTFCGGKLQYQIIILKLGDVLNVKTNPFQSKARLKKDIFYDGNDRLANLAQTAELVNNQHHIPCIL